MELPAIIRPAGAGNDDEHADLLIEALLENDLRRDLDPVSRARGYQRLIDAGRTVKGVAERLQTTQARVREHLRILKLPAELQRKVAVSEIPLRAVKPLTQLESIHPELAAAAAEQVFNPGDTYEAYTWSDVERAPLDVARRRRAPRGSLPATHSVPGRCVCAQRRGEEGSGDYRADAWAARRTAAVRCE